MDGQTPDESALLAHHYQLGELVERGALSVIHRATHRTTHVQYCIKTIDLQRYEANTGLGRQEVDAELEMCASLKHHYICELKDVIAGDKSVHLVFEYLDAEDICFEVVKRAGNGFVYSEAVVSHYMRQLLQALEYLHSNGVVHRDIRPHNINLASSDNSAPLKLCGFGVAVKLATPTSTYQGGRVGVAQFMSPEVVGNEDYGTKTDVWSAGIVLYLLLCGRLPFTGSTDEIYAGIRSGVYDQTTASWSLISGSAKDLLRKLLTVDQDRRISASEALSHEWIRDREHFAPRRHMQETVESIRKYNQNRKLKSSILAAVSTDKWNQLHSSPSTFLNGDVPGGDSCHPDGCTRAVVEKPPADDLSGTHKVGRNISWPGAGGVQQCQVPAGATHKHCPRRFIPLVSEYHRSLLLFSNMRCTKRKSPSPPPPPSILSSLDTMASLCDPSSTRPLPEMNSDLVRLLNLYDKISQLKCGPVVSEQEASAIRRDVVATIDSLLGPSAEALELRQLLLANDMTSCLQAHDVIVSEVCDPEEPKSSTPPPQTAPTANNVSQVPFNYLNGGILPLGAHKAGTSTDDYLQQSFGGDDDDDLLLDSVSRVRLVQFQKDTEEPMGITLKVTEEGRCFVARIMHGGMIHRQATLHVGDEIREINGMSVCNRSVESLQQMLRDLRGQVTFKIVPSYRSAPPACEIFVRAQFDYDPNQDDLIPCPQAGVPFKTGDILQVISKDDHNWWQSRFISCFPSLGGSLNTAQTSQGAIAGLIPSPELQEWRTACLAMERAKDHSHCMWFNRKKKYYTTKYLQKHSALFDQLDLVTYEEVMRLSQFRRKTLVLLGAHGVGRRHIKNTLINRHPARFAYPIPHTTRAPRKDEVDGKHYYFVNYDQMKLDIDNNEYLEYGSHEENMYGTKLETIRNIHKSGKIAILDVEPQALKVLRTAEYSPFVVFIAAPNLQGLQDPDGSLERLLRDSEILRQAFGHLFDYIIVNNDIDDTITQLERIVEKLPACPQWLPVSWVY